MNALNVACHAALAPRFVSAKQRPIRPAKTDASIYERGRIRLRLIFVALPTVRNGGVMPKQTKSPNDATRPPDDELRILAASPGGSLYCGFRIADGGWQIDARASLTPEL
jgi:hypothetical protein